MRNQDRMPAQSVLAKASNGTLTAGTLPIGNTTQGNGSYIVMKTNGGSILAIPCPGVEAGDTVQPSQGNQ